MTGKQKCNILRRIRRDIAAANQLDYTERDCTHTGSCSGTCPYCEAQLKKLEAELEHRRSLGQRIAVMGLSMGLLTTNLSSCDNPLFGPSDRLQGDMMPDSTGTEQTEVANSIPGELIASETTTEPPMAEKGELVVETLMGDPVLPKPTMGVLPLPEIALPDPDADTTGTTAPPPDTTPLMGTMPLETAIAGGIGPAPDLPDPNEVREPETIAVTEPLKTP